MKRGSGITPANAPLTRAIKGLDAPLFDLGNMRRSVAVTIVAWNQAFIGLARSKVGLIQLQAAIVAHNGDTIPVSAKMRAMFKVLAAVSEGEADPSILSGRARILWDRNSSVAWRPLSPATTHIIVPPRPFLKVALKASGLRSKIIKNWEDAINEAFLLLVKK